MLPIGGLTLRGSIVLCITMIALISLKPSAVISRGTRSRAAKTPPPPLALGTAAGRSVRCSRVITDNNNVSKLSNTGHLFCSDYQAKWLCNVHRCYAHGKLAFPLYFSGCKADKGTIDGLQVLAAQYQDIDGLNIAVMGWQVIGPGKTGTDPGLYYCKMTRAALSGEFPKREVKVVDLNRC
ncbi:hypothetical protein KEM48_011712 [Puccinia striiformis f. sp. tritici PST-130]|nr:hypothetical protein H4Q26_012273 [Puccinia striiformis f. sp. tritici PST-130]KAI9628267.1 hypothetical protein KEM48_011712 [Puccinia striiformis f. sp. tritici PST-130]